MAGGDRQSDVAAVVSTLRLPPRVTIRAWDEADFSAIEYLFQAEGWSTPLKRLDNARKAWRHSWPTLVAVSADAVIGFSRALSDGAVTTYVAALLVAPAWRRQGIASALLEVSQRLCPGSQLDLLATAASQPFYERVGFRSFAGYRRGWSERTARRLPQPSPLPADDVAP